MWFVFLAMGLALLIAGGLYVRRRISQALTQFGLSARRTRLVRWAVAWLLFGYPILLFATISISLVSGRATLPRFDGAVATWLLVYPFTWALLVVVQAAPWLVATDLATRVLRRRPAVVQARAIAVLGVVAVFALYTPMRIAIEWGDLRVRSYSVKAGPNHPSSPAVPPMRIAFIADVQQDTHTDVTRVTEVYSVVNASQPDIVLAGGDWINTGPDHIDSAAATAATLSSRLGTFSVRGDHEHFAYVDRERSAAEIEQAMRGRGIEIINNEAKWFDHHGKRVAVVFLNYNYIHRSDPATVQALIARVQNADFKIAVTHQLDRTLAERLRNNVDLVLAGHTHGGQVNPVLGVSHVSLARLETEFIDGRYELGATTVIVTAGIGFSVVPLRYASPGSVERIDVQF